MAVPIFKNNASTILASNITSSQTTLPLNTGTGALFGTPIAGDYFMVTVISASNTAVFEVMQCTGRSGDTLTVVRAQEGTTGQAFNASDVVAQLWTGRDVIDNRQLRNMPTASGTANAQVVANSTPISAWIKGIVQRWVPATSNSGPATVAVDGNTATALRAFGQPLIGSELQVGVPIEGDYDGTNVHLMNPLITALGLANGALEATVFLANGTFTPKATANYLVIAIGGGGGGGGGGGSSATANAGGSGGFGGGGGQLGFAVVSLTAGTSYAVVIGSAGSAGTGGAATTGNGGDGGNGGNSTFNSVVIGNGGNVGRGGGRGGSQGFGLAGGTGSGNNGGVGGALIITNGQNNGNAPGVSNSGGGGGGGGGGFNATSQQAGGNGGAGGTGILIVIRA